MKFRAGPRPRSRPKRASLRRARTFNLRGYAPLEKIVSLRMAMTKVIPENLKLHFASPTQGRAAFFYF